MDRETWWATVHRVAKSQTQLEQLNMHVGMHILYTYNGTQSSALAWKIPWMEELGRLQSMGSQRVGHF